MQPAIIIILRPFGPSAPRSGTDLIRITYPPMSKENHLEFWNKPQVKGSAWARSMRTSQLGTWLWMCPAHWASLPS